MSDLKNVFGQMAWQELPSVMTATELAGGSDEITPKRISFVIKQGTQEQLVSEFDAYLLIARSNERVARFFPRFSYFCEDAERAVLALEDIPGITLEEVILNLARDAADRGLHHAQTQLDQYNMAQYITIATDALRVLGWPVHNNEFNKFEIIQELCDALIENLERAGLPTITLNAHKLGESWKNPVFCVSHRDLSVGNIMCHDARIRFIDPRLSVPYLPAQGNAIGTPLIDPLMLLISLERKQAEIESMYPRLLFLGLHDLRKRVSELKADVPAFLVHLITAVTYAMYAACKCDYCLAPERVDLYNLMVKKTKRSVALLQEASP